MTRHSVVMTGAVSKDLSSHLVREDGQEDLCFATWQPSTGENRRTAILERPTLPQAGERSVHGNVSFEPSYALRAADIAVKAGRGIAFMHSHPGATGWQHLSVVDRKAEARLANLARELTGLPLLGLTLAGRGGWAARVWSGVGRRVEPIHYESVRVIGDNLSTTFNEALLPTPAVSSAQVRTAHAWGQRNQSTIARLPRASLRPQLCPM